MYTYEARILVLEDEEEQVEKFKEFVNDIALCAVKSLTEVDTLNIALLAVDDCDLADRSWNNQLFNEPAFPLTVSSVKRFRKAISCRNNTVTGEGEWTEQRLNSTELIVPWPRTIPAGGFAPHLVLLDRVSKRDVPGRPTVWGKFSRSFKDIGYPADMVWNLSQYHVPMFDYGYGSAKPWTVTMTADQRKKLTEVLGMLVANRLKRKTTTGIHGDYPGNAKMAALLIERLSPKVRVLSGNQVLGWTGEKDGADFTWRFVKNSSAVSAADKEGSQCLYLLEDTNLDPEIYYRYLFGEIFLIPANLVMNVKKRELYSPWRALRGLVEMFCENYIRCQYPELRNSYVALRQLANLSNADDIELIAGCFPETRYMDLALSGPNQSTKLQDPLMEQSLAKIYSTAFLQSGQRRLRGEKA